MIGKLEDVSPSDEQTEKYGRILGIGSVWVLPSIGSLIIFMGIYPIMLVILGVLTLLNKYYPSLTTTRKQFKDVLIWNWLIGFFNDSYIVVVLSCLINIKY
jgi:hypothetical protein